MGAQSFLIFLLALTTAMPHSVGVGLCASADLVVGASRPAVRGVVERTNVASNPLPWGSSISAVTRVWGGVVVERWTTGDELGPCLTPALTPSYQAIGIDEALVPSGNTLSALEQAALTSQFGPPAVFEPSRFDRVMAWFRVFPSLPVVAVLVGWSVVALRRRRHRRDGYLF